jgi:small multidrug resistance pump
MLATYFYLILAIVAEVMATMLLVASVQFTKFWPSVGVMVGYGLSFYLLSIVVLALPIAVVYATWSGVGIAATTLLGYLIYQQSLNGQVLLGLCLVVIGVTLIHGFSVK